MFASKSLGVKKNYDYDNGFQEKILATLLRDPTFIGSAVSVVKSHYFTGAAHKLIAKAAFDYYKEYRSKPSKTSLVQMLQTILARSGLEFEDISTIISSVDELYEIDISDAQYVKDEASQFGRFQAVKLGVLKCVDHIENSNKDPDRYDLDGCLSYLQKALVSGREHDTGVQLFDYLTDLSKVKDDDELSDPRYRVATGFQTIDRCLKGGMGAGELGIVMGESGIGKSMFLTNLAAVASLMAKKVVYITLELKPYEVIIRALARMTGKSMDDVEAGSDTYKKSLTKFDTIGSGYFRVKYFKPSQATTGSIRAYLSRLEVDDGVKPDIILVDYLDEMKGLDPEGDSSKGYYIWGQVCADLIELGDDYKCPVWTATQIQREAYGNDPKLSSMGESMKKVNKADLIVSICQKDSELEGGRMRLRINKMRRGSGKGRYLPCISKLERALMREARNEC